MLLPGTEMHFITFGFICAEMVILFYLIIHWLARRDDKASFLNIILILLLITYNVAGGLLPDDNLPGSYFTQECIAYGTGFITPCYFPYFVYEGFELDKMRFHARMGVWLFLVIPYLLFIGVFAITGSLQTAQNILILPVLYAIWVIISLYHAIRYKYKGDFSSKNAREEIVVLFFSLTPWVGLPFISYFNLSQPVEAITTNTGFLLLLALHLKRNVQQLKAVYRKVMESEAYMNAWNEKLRQEVERQTKELAKLTLEDRVLEHCRQYQLTNRETEIVTYIIKGNTYRQISENLYIAERTVAKHVQNIFEKVQVSNRIELMQRLTD